MSTNGRHLLILDGYHSHVICKCSPNSKECEFGLNYFVIIYILCVIINRHLLFQVIQICILVILRCLDLIKQGERCKEGEFGIIGFIGFYENSCAS
jgi:hypothetical protein